MVQKGDVYIFNSTVILFFALVFWATMYSLSERVGTPSMWHIPKSKLKRGALGLVIPFSLVFFNRPTKPEIRVLVAVMTLLLIYGFSEYLNREKLNVAAFCLAASFAITLVLLAAWHFWPTPSIASSNLPASPPMQPALSPEPDSKPLPKRPNLALHPHKTINHAFTVADTRTSFDNAKNAISISVFGLISAREPFDISVNCHVFLDSAEIRLDRSRFPTKESVAPNEIPEFAMTLDYWPPGGYEAAIGGQAKLRINMEVTYDATVYKFIGEFDPTRRNLLTLYSDWSLVN